MTSKRAATIQSAAKPCAQEAVEDVPTAMATLSAAMQADQHYAWSWHCNVAMTAIDAGAPRENADKWAATFMRNAFGVDTLAIAEQFAAQQQKVKP